MDETPLPEGFPSDVLRWLNPTDAKTSKRRQQQMARFAAMNDAQQLAWMKKQTRYLRTSAATAEAAARSAVNASTPGTPQWQRACEHRDKARRIKEGMDALLRELDREERKDTLRVVTALTQSEDSAAAGEESPR